MTADCQGAHDETLVATAAAWMARLTSGEATDAEWDRFTEWLLADPVHMAAMELIDHSWRSSGALAETPSIRAERRRARGLRVAVPGMASSAVRSARGWRMAIAGAGGLALAACALITLFPPSNYATVQSYTTMRGQQVDAQLPDGSRVRLNTNTRLSVEYGWFGRQIRIDRGEAEFTVAHGDYRPFIVSDAQTSVRATGTIFTVRDLADGMRVFLAEGGVELRRSGDGQVLGVLRPGQYALVTDGGEATIAAADPTRETMWRNGQVVFDGTPLAVAVAEFARYSPAIVEVKPAVADLRISGVYRTGDLIAFLNATSRLHPVRWQQNTGGVLVVEPAAGHR